MRHINKELNSTNNKNNSRSKNKNTSTAYNVFEDYNHDEIRDNKEEIEFIGQNKKKKTQKENINVKKKKRTNVETRKKIATVVGSVAIIIFVLVFAFGSYDSDTTMINLGYLSEEESAYGYVIRDEVTIYGENLENGMEKIVSEGKKVSKDTSVFRYYSIDEDTLNEELSNIDKSLQEKLKGNKIYSSDIKLAEEGIESYLENVGETNDIQSLNEYRTNIKQSITDKVKKIAKLSDIEEIKELIGRREELENQLKVGAEYIKAEKSGMISYRVDGFEEKLNINEINSYNIEYLDNLKLKTGQVIASSLEKGKIVNNFYSILIFNSNSENAKNVKLGNRLKIRIFNNEINATIENIIEENDGSRTIAIKINKDIEELLLYRKIAFDIIWWQEKGYRVENDAIGDENGIKYVIRNRDGYKKKIYVKILKQNSDYAIIEGYSSEELLELGFSRNDIEKMSTISLYDELEAKINE